MNAAELDKMTIVLGGGSQAFLIFILGMMMFSVALGLRPQHFAFFKTDPKHYFTGVVAQMVGLPLVTLGLVYALNPAPSLALGMILVACCPGGNISNILALFGRANTALSVSMTATSSLAAALITPVSILFWSSLYGPTRDLLTVINFDAVDFLVQTLLILGVPIVLGMLVVWKLPKLAAVLQKPLALISATGLVLIIIGGFYSYRDLVLSAGMLILPLVIIHNALALGLGYASGLLSRADVPTRRALTFEVGIQNSGLGFIILLTQLNGLGGTAAITGMWGLWHMVGGGFMVAMFRWADRRSGSVPGEKLERV
ncbi:MAG: bile acid transporter [Robiginitomaculum sp.]|nr:MAG: bile acid transporter [Robiginitomaculum sp.]